MLFFHTPINSKSANVSEEDKLTMIDNTKNYLQYDFCVDDVEFTFDQMFDNDGQCTKYGRMYQNTNLKK